MPPRLARSGLSPHVLKKRTDRLERAMPFVCRGQEYHYVVGSDVQRDGMYLEVTETPLMARRSWKYSARIKLT
jgi:hypothetical protein